MGWGGSKGGGQRYHRGRADQMLAPGKTGFLFTITTGPVDRAKREIESLLERFVVAANGSFAPTAGEDKPQGENDGDTTTATTDTAAATAKPEEKSLVSLLMAELDAVRQDAPGDRNADGNEGSDRRDQKKKQKKKRLGEGDHYHLLETNCKGYLFYQIDRPMEQTNRDDRDDEEEEGAPQEETRKRTREAEEQAEGSSSNAIVAATTATASASGDDGAKVTGDAVAVLTAEEEQERLEKALHRFRANPNVTSVCEALMTQLLSNPEVVARFTFKLIPVVASCNPSLTFIIPMIKRIGESLEIPQGRSAIKISVSIFVRNNTTLEKQKNSIKASVEAALPMSRFVTVQADGADVQLTIAVMHSTCCIGVAHQFAQRHSFNLNRISQLAMKLDDHTTTTTKVAEDAPETAAE